MQQKRNLVLDSFIWSDPICLICFYLEGEGTLSASFFVIVPVLLIFILSIFIVIDFSVDVLIAKSWCTCFC